MSDIFWYRAGAAVLASFAGYVIYMGYANRKLKKDLLLSQLKEKNLEIEKDVHNLSDDALRDKLDKYTKG